MINQLRSWGLSVEDAQALGWYASENIQEIAPRLPPARGIVLPYWRMSHPNEGVLVPGGGQFCRFRVLPHPLQLPGADTSMPKYLQPPDTGVMPYFPRNIAWNDVCADPGIGVLITEGEAKAAKACKEGFPTIGLGGVDSFRSLRSGIHLCKDLAEFPWRGRPCWIVYDSDITENNNIVAAANALAEALLNVGAFPRVAILPGAGSSKVGLDDYLIAHGPEAVDALLKEAPAISAIESLLALNKRYVVVRETASVYDLGNERLISSNSFTHVVEAPKRHVNMKLMAGGKLKPEVVSAADAWLHWPLRAEAAGLVYEPGCGRMVGDRLNIWPGWGVDPKPGDCSLFDGLLDYMFAGEPENRDWFLKWLAYPIQNPGVKMYTAAVLYSLHHGTGKSFLGQIIGKIYGKNYAEVKRDDLSASFNSWAENKQFILGDEITGSDRRAESDALKRLITASELRVNKKYIEEFVLRDCVNYLFTTNHPDAFFLEDNDRRFFVHEIQGTPLPDSFYEALHNFIYVGNGAAAVLDYILCLDVTGFNPRARAKDTLSKQHMFDNSLGDLASWMRIFKRDPDARLQRLGTAVARDLVTAQELLDLYNPIGQAGKVTKNGVVREAVRAGLPYACSGHMVKTERGLEKVFIIKNASVWLGASPAEIAEHLQAHPIGYDGKF